MAVGILDLHLIGVYVDNFEFNLILILLSLYIHIHTLIFM
jgi:hypothetical protein